jgi:hypothetical protein
MNNRGINQPEPAPWVRVTNHEGGYILKHFMPNACVQCGNALLMSSLSRLLQCRGEGAKYQMKEAYIKT